MVATLENKTTIPAQLEGEFKTLLGKTFASEPEWLKEKRKEAFELFSQKGIPTRRNEDYKYTDARKIFDRKFTAVHNELHKLTLTIDEIAVDKNSIKLIFINGWLYKDSTLSSKLPKGVVIGNMASDGLLLQSNTLKKYLGTTASKDSLADLNSALWFDGAFIYVPEKTVLDKPIEIIHISTGSIELLVNPRHLIVLEKNSEAQVIEHSISMNAEKHILVNSHAEVFVGENAKLQFYRIQNGCQNVSQISTVASRQGGNSHFDTNTISLGNAFVRNNLRIALEGENCETHLNGLFVVKGNEFIDNHTAIQHNKPNCRSNQLYKGILDEKSTGIFNGKIFVARDAQKTNAYQSSKNILLSDDATINTKPELEIYADDVKCSHGSSTGKVDENAMFYLRARGLGEDSARRLLLSAFANDVLNTIKIESLKIYLEELVNEKLEK